MNSLSKNIRDAPIIVVAGPTASGKSDFALDIARKVRGTIINFDSMQVYKELKILSARPSKNHCQTVPHELYGFMSADTPCSVLYWRDIAIKKIKISAKNGRIPILVGGTGFYIQSLIDGIDSIPKSLPEFRCKAEKIFKQSGYEAFYNIVKKVDPSVEGRIAPKDIQRLIRSYTVWLQTSKTLYEWQNQGEDKKKYFNNFIKIRLYPDREKLRNTISERFYRMVDEGAVQEVRSLKKLDLSYPIMKAHGVRELLAYSSGNISFEEAAKKTITNIRQYAKRQDTWFNNRFKADYKIIDYKNNLKLHLMKIYNLCAKIH